MIYDFTNSFIPKLRQIEHLNQKLNRRFSHTKIKFHDSLSHKQMIHILTSIESKCYPNTQFQIDISN